MCAILAAGRSARMREPKTLLRVGGRTLLERALDATAAYECVLVTSSALAETIDAGSHVSVVRNDRSERGMTHSLRLADAAVTDRDAALAVVLADTPFVDARLVARVVAARGAADVAYPVRDGVPGHPVVLGPGPRALLSSLPDGDMLRDLRDQPRWTRIEVPVDDDRPFFDCDTPADVLRAAALLEAVEPAPPTANA